MYCVYIYIHVLGRFYKPVGIAVDSSCARVPVDSSCARGFLVCPCARGFLVCLCARGFLVCPCARGFLVCPCARGFLVCPCARRPVRRPISIYSRWYICNTNNTKIGIYVIFNICISHTKKGSILNRYILYKM